MRLLDYFIRGPRQITEPSPRRTEWDGCGDDEPQQRPSPNPKVVDSSQRQIKPTPSHTCGFLKESNLVNDFILKACHDACVFLCQEKESRAERRKERETKVLVNMTTVKF